MRGDIGDAYRDAYRSLNFQSPSMSMWPPQRLDPLLSNSQDYYQAMAASAMNNDIGSSDAMKQQQFVQFQHQQQFQFSQQASPIINPLLLQQQLAQQVQMMNAAESRSLPENQTHTSIMSQQMQQPQHNDQQKHNYSESNQILNNHMDKQQLTQKTGFPDSNPNLASVLNSNYAYQEGSSNIMDFSNFAQSPGMSEQHNQAWESKLTAFGNNISLPPFPGKNGSLEAENHNLFGANMSSPNQLSNAGHNLMNSNSVDNDVSNVPYASSYVQNSIYGSIDESSSTMQNSGEVDPSARNFVKVDKSGAVGRSLDIGRFSNYDELREELGLMFGIEGLLEDPPRSGWQLVFVDKENDILLLGDDPWEEFMNNVRYIKILSPEDVQKMGT